MLDFELRRLLEAVKAGRLTRLAQVQEIFGEAEMELDDLFEELLSDRDLLRAAKRKILFGCADCDCDDD